jgi:probable LLM family oxidoreductase
MTIIELGLDTFGDITADAAGNRQSAAQVIRDVVAEAVLADQTGVDFIGLGEHHRPDFAISSPDMILAAIAARTTRIHLGTAVTVLSSDDPVRVFERFSTLDALSNGRAEIILGRGSFTESFPLFGFSLDEYEVLFAEKLDLFATILEYNKTGEPFSWKGSIRTPLAKQRVYPATESGRLTTWIGVGGSPQSVVRAAHYGFPLTLAIIGGDPRRFLSYVELYRRETESRGLTLPIAVHSPGHIAETDELAREQFWPGYQQMRNRIGAERGWPPANKSEFEQEIQHGSLYVGSAETVARKIAATILTLGVDRFDMKYGAGPQRHEDLLNCIELYGRTVVPRVRELVAEGRPKTTSL